MKKLRLLFCLIAIATAPALSHAQGLQTPAPTATPAPLATPVPAGTSDEAPAAATPKPANPLSALPLSPIATQLGQTLQNLVGTTTAQPAPAAAAPATATALATDTTADDTAGQVTDSFINDVLDSLTQLVADIKADNTNFTSNFKNLPELKAWIKQQSSDPRREALWGQIGGDLLIIVGVPLLAGIACLLLLLPLRLKLRERTPETILGRVSVLAGLFAFRVVPVLIFIGAALLLLDQNETHRLPRYVIINVIYAITLSYTLRQVLRAIFAPATDHLRLFSFTTKQAVYAYRWFSAFTLSIVFAYFTVATATAVRVPLSAIIVFQNIVGFLLTVMAIIVIVQTRIHVALIIRGKRTDADQHFGYALREWLARHWHSLTITYLVISFGVTVLGIDNGIALMLRGTILTFIVLVVSRLLFLALDHWAAPQANNVSLVHRQILSFLIRPLIWVVAVVSIFETWGFHVSSLIATPSGQRAFGAFMSIVLTLFFLTVVYEALNTSIERHLGQRDKNSKQPVASARARTLLPMVRNTIFILFSGIAILTFLSAVGFNIGPVLAGAGVVGVAIGFGSQSLVKDFLTGLFIVVENSVAVGDIVKIGGFGGVVETLSIRTIRLRDSDGALHILPFSEVTKISNMSKGFAYALVDVSVAYDSNLERVMQVLREIGAEVQEDPIYKRVILEPIEVQGVESLGDSSISLRARIRTRPGKQYDVRRLLLLRIQQRFEKENIEIPFPTVTQVTKAPKSDAPPPEPPIKMQVSGPGKPGI